MRNEKLFSPQTMNKCHLKNIKHSIYLCPKHSTERSQAKVCFPRYLLGDFFVGLFFLPESKKNTSLQTYF